MCGTGLGLEEFLELKFLDCELFDFVGELWGGLSWLSELEGELLFLLGELRVEIVHL